MGEPQSTLIVPCHHCLVPAGSLRIKFTKRKIKLLREEYGLIMVEAKVPCPEGPLVIVSHFH